MKLFLFMTAGVLAFLVAGCHCFDHAIPPGAAKEIAYQLGEEPELLLIPVCDYGDSLELASPRVISYPYKEISVLEKECSSPGTLLPWKPKQPVRFLLLTRKGELYSATSEDSTDGDSGIHLYRTRLDADALHEFATQLALRKFEITEATSLFLAPESPAPEKPLPVSPCNPEEDWSEALTFLDEVNPFEEYFPPTPFNRSYARHGIYCAAGESHIKPDYPPGSVLTLTFQPEKPVLLEQEEFIDRAKLRNVLKLHLASGKYALVKLKLIDLVDVFELERDGIAPLLRQMTTRYGSDFLIELPGGTAIWRCSRCFTQP